MTGIVASSIGPHIHYGARPCSATSRWTHKAAQILEASIGTFGELGYAHAAYEDPCHDVPFDGGCHCMARRSINFIISFNRIARHASTMMIPKTCAVSNMLAARAIIWPRPY